MPSLWGGGNWTLLPENQLAYTGPPGLSLGERAQGPHPGSLEGRVSVLGPLGDHRPKAPSLSSTDHYRVSNLTTEASADQGHERHLGPGAKGSRGTGRDGAREEGGRCSGRQNQPFVTPVLSVNSAPEGPVETGQVSTAKAAMCSGCPGPAPALVASAAPWSRSTGTRPPAPRAGSKTRLCALPRGCPPRRSWS